MRFYCIPVYVSQTQIQCDTNPGMKRLKRDSVPDVIVGFTIVVIQLTRRIVHTGYHGKIMNIPVNKGFPEPSKGTPDPSRTSLFCV